MTDQATLVAPYVQAGHPVRRFVIALVTLAVIFGALWWSGLAAPRLSVPGTAGVYDNATGRGVAHLRVRNEAPVPIEVRHVGPGADRVTFTSVRVNGRDVATGGQRVAGGGTAMVDIEYTCRPEDPLEPQLLSSPQVGLEFMVRTPIGLERTRAAGTVSLVHACTG